MTTGAVAGRPLRKKVETNEKVPSEGTFWRSRIVFTAMVIVLVVAIGYTDYVTGPEIGFSLFYLGPIVAAAWYAGRRSSVMVALTAAVCWFVADYLVRTSLPLSLWNGLTRLVIYVAQGWLVATLHEDRRREGVLARTDSVTQLPNSRSFLESLEAAVGQDRAVGVMYVDLDNFKRVNDLFGHAAGDAVLLRTAEVLRKAVRSTDVVARVGGDEFAILLQDAMPDTYEAIARRMIEGGRRIAADYEGTGFGASIGVAISVRGAVSAEGLLKPADDAMYEAKQRLKGSYVIRNVE